MQSKINFKLTIEYLAKLKALIAEKNKSEIKKLLNALHETDIAGIYDELSIEEVKFLYLQLEQDKASDVLAELEDDDREVFLKALPSNIIASKFIANMDTDDAADVLADLSSEKMKEVLSYIDDLERAVDIIDLLNYDEDTAGGLMGKELIAAKLNWTASQCIDEIRKQAAEIDEIYYVYVVDDNEMLQGTLSLKKLIQAKPETKIEVIYNSGAVTVDTDTDSEQVARIMEKYDMVALPVIDSINRLVGRITIDDVVDVIKDEAERDYQLASGIYTDVESTDSVWLLTKARLPWLLIGLTGGIFGALVMGNYEKDLSENATMAFFIPLIAAMGGNVGVQSSAIVVQGLANNTLGIESTWQKIVKEVSVALINGITCSSIIFIYNLLFSDSFALTLSVSISLIIVILFASVFGTFIPLALNRFKIDPALATGPFITTINDILGLFFYLIIGRLIFSLF